MSKQSRKKYSKNFWNFLSDFQRDLINKGQFPVLLLFLFFVILTIRMPQKDVSKFAFEILDFFKTGSLLGWILSGLFLILWFITMRIQRRKITSEMNEIAKKRDRWQKRALGKDKIESTEDEK